MVVLEKRVVDRRTDVTYLLCVTFNYVLEIMRNKPLASSVRAVGPPEAIQEEHVLFDMLVEEVLAVIGVQCHWRRTPAVISDSNSRPPA
jgi:hypothetical protein